MTLDTRLFAAVLVLAIVTTPVSAAPDVYDIDADHGLADEDRVREYEETGFVSTEVLVPSLTISIAEDHDDVDVDQSRLDSPYHYVRLQYNETLPVRLRIYFPAGYWHPQTHNLEALEADVEAELRPVSDSQYSSLEVRFDGRTDAVFAIPKTASLVFATRDYGNDFVENRTDMELPSLASQSDPWAYIDEAAVTGSNTTVAIQKKQDKPLTIQYDAGDDEERWIGVPACSATTGDGEPVCRFTRDGEPNRVYILSRVSNPPPIRYKYDPGLFVSVKDIQDSISVTLDRAFGWVGNLFGGT